MRARARTLSRLSGGVSLKSVKSAAETLPKQKACPWVAQWFTVPQLVVKILQLLFGLVAVSLVFQWQSEGVTIKELDRENYNFKARMYCYAALGLLSSLYSLILGSLGIGGLKLPPSVQTILAGSLLFLWLLGAPVMSATVEELGHTSFARTAGLDILLLEIATVLGFLSLVASVFDILLSFLALRSLDDSRQFTLEVQRSKSVVMAARSGRSLAEARQAPVTRQPSRSRDDPVTDISPLKSHEDLDSSDEETSRV